MLRDAAGPGGHRAGSAVGQELQNSGVRTLPSKPRCAGINFSFPSKPSCWARLLLQLERLGGDLELCHPLGAVSSGAGGGFGADLMATGAGARSLLSVGK